MQTYQELMIEAEMEASRFGARKDAVNNGFWKAITVDMTFDAPLTYAKLAKLELAEIKIHALSHILIDKFRKYQWKGLNTS